MHFDCCVVPAPVTELRLFLGVGISFSVWANTEGFPGLPFSAVVHICTCASARQEGCSGASLGVVGNVGFQPYELLSHSSRSGRASRRSHQPCERLPPPCPPPSPRHGIVRRSEFCPPGNARASCCGFNLHVLIVGGIEQLCKWLLLRAEQVFSSLHLPFLPLPTFSLGLLVIVLQIVGVLYMF